ncbi:MAG: Ig-like domain-containing protein, partial [Clostridia bacterium]|nr:Ig-like domain-containing protein [Clostridia bacterium]
LKLKAAVSPSGAKTKLTWSSSNEKVAKVTQNGVVSALKKGSATITVKTSNGLKATCKITVPTPPRKVQFARKSYTVKVGKTVKLGTKLTPSGAKTTFTWSSSDKKIATVTSKGVVKGLKKGSATITVKTANGLKATVKVTVE